MHDIKTYTDSHMQKISQGLKARHLNTITNYIIILKAEKEEERERKKSSSVVFVSFCNALLSLKTKCVREKQTNKKKRQEIHSS